MLHLRTYAGLFVGLAALLVMLLVPAPAGVPAEAWRVAAVAALMATWWITEAIPIPATALVPLVLFPVLGITPIAGTAAPYANPIIFLFLGGFMIAAALQETGLHRRVALIIVGMVGTSPARLVAGFMAATGFLSMWVSNTATVVMMLPVALSILELHDRDGGAARDGAGAFGTALLLGVAYAASIGGMGTLIGTPPNALLAGFMNETYGIEIGFMQWMLFGVPIVLVAMPFTWWMLTRVLFTLGSAELAGGREVIRAELRALGPLSRAEMLAGSITAMTAIAWIVRPLLEPALPALSDTGIAIAGALLLFVVRADWRAGKPLLDWTRAEQLPWGVLLLFGGGLSLAGAIERTGLAASIGSGMAAFGTWPLVVVLIAITTVIVFLTELTSNTATAAAFLPIVAATAVGIGADPMTLAIPTALAASAAFMMPVATPPNAIVFGSGRLTIAQMARAGFLLNLFFIALITVAVTLLLGPVFG